MEKTLEIEIDGVRRSERVTEHSSLRVRLVGSGGGKRLYKIVVTKNGGLLLLAETTKPKTP